MKATRRSFIQTVSFAAASAALAQQTPPKPLPIAFSTLGCPAWDFPKILDFAAQNGFAAVELRGLMGNMTCRQIRCSHPIASKKPPG